MDSNTLKQRAIAFNYLFDAVVVTDAQGIITDWNKGSENLYGYSKEELIGKPVSILHVPEDVDHVTSEVIASVEKYGRWSGEVRMLHKDGHIGWIESMCVPIMDNNNQMVGALGINRDITKSKNIENALRESEHRFRSLVETTDDWIWAINLEGIHTYSNPSIKNILGYEPEEIVGKPSFALLHEEDLIKVQKTLPDILKAKAGWSGWVLRWRHKDGTYKYLESNAVPILDGSGEVIAFQGTDRDITERMHTEEQLRRSQKMDALGKLTGGIAHDYNNMLGVIMGYANLLEDALTKQPELAKYAHEIHHASKRGAKLTNKLLAFSRQRMSEANCINLNSLLLSQQHMLEKTLTVRIELVLKLAEDLWSTWIDDSEMEDIIINMSINAMHAIDSNGQLIIRTSNEQLNQLDAQSLGVTPGDYVLLSITDTGCGMDEATKEKIFEPFFSTKGDQGTGLGLSQVYGFVHSSGGAINVYSEPNQSTRFALYFPRHNESNYKQSIKDNNAIDIRGTETILLVDDEAALLELNCEIVAQQGFNVISAESAKKALEILEHETVDLLVSDIIMPEIDGYQLAAMVKEKYPGIKIQLISGFTDDRNMSMIDENLQKNILYKPFNSQSLLQRIHELLNE